jgi:hypothetical protein
MSYGPESPESIRTAIDTYIAPLLLLAPRRHALPLPPRQQGDLHLSVPRLDLLEHRQAPQGEGPRGRRLPRAVQQTRLPRPDPRRPLRELPRLPLRQPQRRGRLARRRDVDLAREPRQVGRPGGADRPDGRLLPPPGRAPAALARWRRSPRRAPTSRSASTTPSPAAPTSSSSTGCRRSPTGSAPSRS